MKQKLIKLGVTDPPLTDLVFTIALTSRTRITFRAASRGVWAESERLVPAGGWTLQNQFYLQRHSAGQLARFLADAYHSTSEAGG